MTTSNTNWKKNCEALQGQNILALDYGQKVTGLASYRVAIDPFPLLQDRIVESDSQKLMQVLSEMIEQESYDLVVVGIPYFVDGSESRTTKERMAWAQAFAKKLGQIPLFFVDECLSTEEAKERMLNSPQFNFQIDLRYIDSMSAKVILESFLRLDDLQAQRISP